MDKLDRAQLLEHSLSILEEYENDGLSLTLRQLYYKFVSLGLMASSAKEYKRLGATLTAARYEGSFPIEGLEDRGRTVGHTDAGHVDLDVDKALAKAVSSVRILPEVFLSAPSWARQDTYVSVWVEKEALAGVFESVTNELGVGMFACKGYPSVSSLYEWLEQASIACSNMHVYLDETGRKRCVGKVGCERCVILYFGDFDPDGMEIPKASLRNLRKLARVKEWEVEIEVVRVALNMDQIEAHRPPPFDAKMTSARYATYRREHQTDHAWELDALEPRTLRALIRDSVARYFCEETAQAVRDDVELARARMRERMREEDFLRAALEG